MGKKKTMKEAMELANLSKQLKEFISDSVDGMSIHEGISVMCIADAHMLHDFAMSVVDDENDVNEYLSALDSLTFYYMMSLQKAIDKVIKAKKENVKISNHGNKK